MGTGGCPDATGKGGGTYCALALNMQKVCGAQVTIDVQQSKGSFDNIQGILDNNFSAGIAQFDVMRYFEEKDDGMARIKVLLPLHVEEIHIVGLNKAYKEGGLFGIGAKSVELQTLKDLAGRKVAAWGGSVLSAEYFAYKAKLGYTVVDLTGQEKPELVAAKMLADGEAHAIFAVGGAPLGWLRNEKVFGKQFKLLSIPSDIGDQVRGTYNTVKVNYPNLTNGQVQSLGVQALLVTRDYRSGDRATALTKLKRCAVENLDNFRDMTGMHPKWQSVEPATKFDRWANYEPPASAVVAPAAPTSAPQVPTKKK